MIHAVRFLTYLTIAGTTLTALTIAGALVASFTAGRRNKRRLRRIKPLDSVQRLSESSRDIILTRLKAGTVEIERLQTILSDDNRLRAELQLYYAEKELRRQGVVDEIDAVELPSHVRHLARHSMIGSLVTNGVVTPESEEQEMLIDTEFRAALTDILTTETES